MGEEVGFEKTFRPVAADGFADLFSRDEGDSLLR